MDFKRSFRAMALLMLGMVSFTACDDEEDDLKKSSNKVIYVLNEGSWNNNNASVSAIDPTDGSSYYYQFAAANGRNLGDTGQDILRYGGKIYIAVSGSNTIEVVDGNSLTSIKTNSCAYRPHGNASQALQGGFQGAGRGDRGDRGSVRYHAP